jgi:hypothetical protein
LELSNGLHGGDPTVVVECAVGEYLEIAVEMQFLRELAHSGKIAQGRFIARKRK